MKILSRIRSPRGLVVMTSVCQACEPGSIPGCGESKISAPYNQVGDVCSQEDGVPVSCDDRLNLGARGDMGGN